MTVIDRRTRVGFFVWMVFVTLATTALTSGDVDLGHVVGAVAAGALVTGLTYVDEPLEKRTAVVGATVLSTVFVAAALWLSW